MIPYSPKTASRSFIPCSYLLGLIMIKKTVILICVSCFIAGCFNHRKPMLKKILPSLPKVIHVRYKPDSSGAKPCAKCHREIYNEWAGSFHAQAAISESFVRESDQYEFSGCMACHAPQTLPKNDERPQPRNWMMHEGVTCSSCHVIGDKTLGSLGSKAPHGSSKDLRFRTSDICASCHQSTFAQWKETSFAKENITCQACHMPMLKRHISDFSPQLYKKKDSRKHSWEIDFSDLVKLSIKTSSLVPGQIEIQIKNSGAGHALPTGIYGNTKVFVVFTIFDQDRRIFFREEKLSARQKNSIGAGETRRFFYHFSPPAMKSYLMVAKVIFSSSNHADEVKLAEVQKYFYQENSKTP
jgi:hypothetical protein